MKPEEDPDVQLMLAVQQDDSAAFETLFRKHLAKVVGFASSFVGSRARAEEIAQETFVRIYRTRRRYQPRARFSTWLYRIATNLCVSETRRTEHRLAHRAADGREGERREDEVQALADPNARTAEEDLLAREEVDRVRMALESLPSQQRAALLLARVEGLSYAEVAATLHCSVSAVKSLVHRATIALRDRMEADRP